MILITGAAGYIGSHATLKFINSGFKVVLFDNLATGHLKTIDTLKNTTNGSNIIDFIQGDLQNFDDINNVFKNHKIDAVIHFAAFSQVNESIQNPQKYIKNNIEGSHNLIKAMIKNDVKKIIFSSTAAVYGEPKYTPIDENHPKKPINPYGETKLAVENLLDEYDKSDEIKSIRLRYFNVAGASSIENIGEVHNPETHLIPNVLKAAFGEAKEFKLFGVDYDTKDGTCIRDYINVEDLIEAHKLALEYLNQNNKTEVFNLGTNEGSSVKEVFSTCEKITNKEIPLKEKPRREGDPAILIASNFKAKKELNWLPKRTFENSIRTAWEWELYNLR